MIQVTEKNDIQSNVGQTRNFTIAANAEMFATISSRLYTNPIRAIIRELVSNAIDANIAKGVDDPIKLHLPTRAEPEFYVEDSGIGMDENTINTIYTQYGNSTKTDTNDQIGGLGLGSKTPFSYTTQFTVESGTGKERKTYTAFMNEDNIPQITPPLNVEQTERTGTKVSFAVDTYDISDFYKEAVVTLMFSKQMPEIVGGGLSRLLEVAEVSTLEEFNDLRELCKDTIVTDKRVRRVFDYSSYSNFVVEMGGVVYSVDSSQVLGGDRWSGLLRYIAGSDTKNVFILHLPIGSVAIQASREALNYTKHTKEVIDKALVCQFVDQIKKIHEMLIAA